jgi:hypothetical protein
MERQRNVWSSEYPGARIAELLDSAEDSLRFGPNDTIDTVQVRQDRLRAAVRARREWDAK